MVLANIRNSGKQWIESMGSCGLNVGMGRNIVHSVCAPPRGPPLFIRFHFFLMSEYHVDVAMQIVHKLSYLVTEQIFPHNMSIADI
jgi:hypothetical protein